jgi:hypothetical protein
MSMNLALAKGNKTDYNTLLQTPSYITYEALDSTDTLQVYKDWVMDMREGVVDNYTAEHFSKVGTLIEDGWIFIMV